MNIIRFDSSRLPPRVQLYADGDNVPAPTYPSYSREVIHLAKQLRRIALRKFTNEYPGLQWSKFPDYHVIMGQEIKDFGNKVLQKKINITSDGEWEKLCLHCPRLTFIFNEYTKNKDLGRPSVVRNLRLIAWNMALRDPRTLGEIEEYVLGRVRFGIPTGTNFPPRN